MEAVVAGVTILTVNGSPEVSTEGDTVVDDEGAEMVEHTVETVGTDNDDSASVLVLASLTVWVTDATVQFVPDGVAPSALLTTADF